MCGMAQVKSVVIDERVMVEHKNKRHGVRDERSPEVKTKR